MPRVSSKSDDIERLLAGVNEMDVSVDCARMAGREGRAEEASESV